MNGMSPNRANIVDNWSLIINAGGESQRMGHPKALLPLDGRPLVATIVERLQGLAAQGTTVIANNPQIRLGSTLGTEVRWLSDLYENIGPLGGIATGLNAITGWGIFVACDMPLLNYQLLERLCTIASETDDNGVEQWDAVVPIVHGYPEPLHACYHRRCYAAVAQSITTGRRRATSFLADVRVRYVQETELCAIDPELRSFLNANTPEEWQRILALLQAQDHEQA